MAKLSKDELISKISEKVTDENVAIELLEDLSDSFDTSEVDNLRNELTTKDAEIQELKTKYKERFLNGNSIIPPKMDETPSLVEKQIIDIKEI